MMAGGRMRVLLDGYWWHEGPPSNAMVQRELVRGWARTYPEDELVMAVPAAHLEAVRDDVPAGVELVGVRRRPHGVAVMTEYPSVLRRTHADLAVTHNFVPWGVPSVVFLHDVLFQDQPRWFTPAERLYLAPVTALLPRAGAVVTSSAHEARRIERLNPRVGRVRPIGIAPDARLATLRPVRPSALAGVDDFVLTVGRLNVRKNLGTVIEAAVRTGEIDRARPLVVVGGPDGRGPGFGPQARRAVEDGAVLLTGHVADVELAWLYRNAALFVFLSLDEGFGLPPVEALSFGTPVVASDIGVFRETIGAHARLVDPLDVDAAAVAIRHELARGRGAPVPPPAWDDAAAALRDTAAGLHHGRRRVA
ncbi:glycosyltransferase family 4 protein [Cellulomonas sp. zg-ZUI40]|nr:glycosyltransferase family 4 protein [Cellulomonas dongxiuzhuiae]